MLKVRVIPTLLLRDSSLVKGKRFASDRPIGTLLQATRLHSRRDVDEMMIFDVSASSLSRGPDLSQIAHVTREVRVPLSVGGGINGCHGFEKVLMTGADKVVVNTSCYSNPTVVSEASSRFGSQCVVASVDARWEASDRQPTCMSHSGSIPEPVDFADHILNLEQMGAGELVVGSVTRDGMMTGYDLRLLELAASLVSIPIIISGGCGSYHDMLTAVVDFGASAVAAASIFQFTELTPLGAREFLAENGVPVRDSETAH
jgi:cyclase